MPCARLCVAVELFDAHLHLDDAAFEPDRSAVVARAQAAGVVGMVTSGTGLASSLRCLALADPAAGIYAAVGIHPHDAHTASAADIERLRALAADPRAVAVGETGLDRVRGAPFDAQVAAFRSHIRLARERALPLVVHCRDAYAEVLEVLEEEAATAVILHAFAGPPEAATACAERGYFISIGGAVTFPRAAAVREAARRAPLELLLLETDAPVLTPVPHRGQRNEPALLVEVARAVAALRGLPLGDLAAATTRNARRAFGVEQT
ncbi:MAG TPA: TatD family hydrolase [bacterium]|nr:TatD family hydrolase [bacterium]